MNREKKPEGVSLSQQGLWTFLFFTLVGPFFGAITGVVLLLAASATGLDLGEEATAAVSRLAGNPGMFAVTAFVWSAVPATIAGLFALGIVVWSGRLGAAEAGIAGVIGFAAAVVLIPFQIGGFLPYLAFTAGLVAVLVQMLLKRFGIVSAE